MIILMKFYLSEILNARFLLVMEYLRGVVLELLNTCSNTAVSCVYNTTNTTFPLIEKLHAR